MQSDRINIPTHCGMAMDPEMQILYRGFKVKEKKSILKKSNAITNKGRHQCSVTEFRH